MTTKADVRIILTLLYVTLSLTRCGSLGGSTPVTPATITATSGTPQSAQVGTVFSPLGATVTDSHNNPVSGISVTFTAPSTGASCGFPSGTTNVATTNSSGVASSTCTANTAVGAYTVTASVSGVSAPANFSLTNSPAAASTHCSFYLSGLEAPNGPNFYALVGSIGVDANGNVTGGEQDYNDASGLISPEPQGDSIMGGSLTLNGSTGQGTLTLITNNSSLGVNGTETLGVQFVNAQHALVVQFDGTATSSGSMDQQTLPSSVSGGYAFVLSGVDPSYLPVAIGGVFSANGSNLSGVLDINDNAVTTAGTAFGADLSVPDPFGRGAITGLANPATGTPITLVYYVVSARALRIIDVDIQDSAVGSAFGQGTSTFTNESLLNSVFGMDSNPLAGTLYAAAGMFSIPTTGTINGVADVDEEGDVVSASAIAGTFSISNTVNSVTYNGYGSLTINPGALEDISVLGIYMTDPALNLNDPNNAVGGGGALLLDLDGVLAGGTGTMIPQADTSTANLMGTYAFGAHAYYGLAQDGWEFDLVGQGSVASLTLNGAGLVSDPFDFFAATPSDGTDARVMFSGPASADPNNPGRYTMPLTVTVGAGPPVILDLVIYWASDKQLFWLNEDYSSLFFGPLQQQGSLAELPAGERVPARSGR